MELRFFDIKFTQIIAALEKNNDDAHRNFHSSNKLDGAKEILLADAHMEELADYERHPRKYTTRQIS